MKEIDFTIINWFAWAPGLENKEDWLAFAQNKKTFSQDLSLSPSIDFVDSIARRRLSQLTKMSLKTAFECTNKYQNNFENIFASRYGELNQTLKLLKSVSADEDLSPASFSLSVHNTAAGTNSLISKNKKSYTAISAAEITFEAAIIEALGRLQNQEAVLMVIGEEYIEDLKEKSAAPFCLALLLGKNDGKKITATIGEAKNIPNNNVSLSFLKWLLSEQNQAFQTKLISFTA